MMWFETLTGFPEESPQQVRKNITVDGNVLKSHINGKILVCGQLETPTLAALRELVHTNKFKGGKISARILNVLSNGNNRLFLTLLGGGAFGNEIDWILGGIQHALNLSRQEMTMKAIAVETSG